MYQIINNMNNQCIKRIDDGAFIPFSDGNTDYQTYLKWVAEGNIAEEYQPE